MQIYKVVMFGDREWTNNLAIRREIKLAKRRAARRNCELVIFEGGAPGADQMCAFWGRKDNVHVCETKALWETRHRGAGPQRNEVQKLLEPREGICFHTNLSKSRGSADMKRKLERAGIPVKVVTR